MLTIAINHLTWMFSEADPEFSGIPTLSSFGFSSTADLFFFLSGYTIGMVYLSHPNFQRKLFLRAWLLYVVNFSVFIAVAGIIVLVPGIASTTATDFVISDPAAAFLRFATLTYAPDLMDVLQTYVVIMLIAAPSAWLLLRNKAIAITCSTAVWAIVQAFPALNLIGGNAATGWTWTFNPLAWQFLVVVGMSLGQAKAHRVTMDFLQKHAHWTYVALAMFVVTAAVEMIDPFEIDASIWVARTSLGVLRLVDFAITLAVLCGFVAMTTNWHMSVPFMIVAKIGRQTLYVFASSIVLTYAALAIWVQLGHPYLLYPVLALILAVLVWFVARWREEVLRNRRQQAGAA